MLLKSATTHFRYLVRIANHTIHIRLEKMTPVTDTKLTNGTTTPRPHWPPILTGVRPARANLRRQITAIPTQSHRLSIREQIPIGKRARGWSSELEERRKEESELGYGLLGCPRRDRADRRPSQDYLPQTSGACYKLSNPRQVPATTCARTLPAFQAGKWIEPW